MGSPLVSPQDLTQMLPTSIPSAVQEGGKHQSLQIIERSLSSGHGTMIIGNCYSTDHSLMFQTDHPSTPYLRHSQQHQPDLQDPQLLQKLKPLESLHLFEMPSSNQSRINRKSKEPRLSGDGAQAARQPTIQKANMSPSSFHLIYATVLIRVVYAAWCWNSPSQAITDCSAKRGCWKACIDLEVFNR